MGNQSQTPNTPTQQPERSGAGTPDPQGDREREARRGSQSQGKEAGNVPRSDDDLAEDGGNDEGTGNIDSNSADRSN
jgi:hypothetical protein